MKISEMEKYYMAFLSLCETKKDDRLTMTEFYDNFPFEGISECIATLNSFFDQFPYAPALERRIIELNYARYFTEFRENYDLDMLNLREQNSAMNIWESIGLGKQEVRHCQFLTWLFNPKGDHGQQDLFLRCFLQTIGLSDIYKETQLFSVRREESVGDYGRLDISIGNSQFWLIIEVKIDAGEQSEQILRYSMFLGKLSLWRSIPAENCKLLYLTPDRRQPDTSIEVMCIDWQDIASALNLFCGSCRNPLVEIIVKQYRDFITNLCWR